MKYRRPINMNVIDILKIISMLPILFSQSLMAKASMYTLKIICYSIIHALGRRNIVEHNIY